MKTVNQKKKYSYGRQRFWGLIKNAGQRFLALQEDNVADPQALRTPQDPLWIWGVLTHTSKLKSEEETI